MERRNGTLWEGRYKSSPTDKDEYFLACTRYIELNPVRAGIVDEFEDYRWSSYSQKLGKEPVDWLDLGPCYAGFGLREEERVNRYRELIKGSILEAEWTLIKQAVQRGQLSGSNRFIEEVEKKIGKRIEFRRQGRPMGNDK